MLSTRHFDAATDAILSWINSSVQWCCLLSLTRSVMWIYSLWWSDNNKHFDFSTMVSSTAPNPTTFTVALKSLIQAPFCKYSTGHFSTTRLAYANIKSGVGTLVERAGNVGAMRTRLEDLRIHSRKTIHGFSLLKSSLIDFIFWPRYTFLFRFLPGGSSFPFWKDFL